MHEKLLDKRSIQNSRMKPTVFCSILFAFLLISCGDDDSVSCVKCQSEITPEFVLCNSNGNATVNGEDTGVSYNTYLQDLNNEGVECF